MSLKRLRLIQFVIGMILILGLGQAEAASWQQVQTWQTQQGVPVYFVQTQGPDMVDVAIAWRAGSAYDQDHPGLAYLTNQLLTQATSKQTSQQLAKKLDQLGVQLDQSVNRDQSIIHLRMLSDDQVTSQAGSLFDHVISEMAFSKKDFKSIQNQTRNQVALNEQSPDRIAERLFYKTLYQNHPYAHPVLGKKTTLQHITPDTVKQFYHRYYTAGNAVIAIVGQLTLSQAKRLSHTVTQHLRSGKVNTQLPQPKPLAHGRTITRAFPSQQTHIFMGHLGIGYGNRDQYALMVANPILGQTPLTSRLFQQVRNRNGLAYSVYSTFEKLAARGPFYINLQTRTAKAPQALAITRQTYRQFLQAGVTPKEVKQSRSFIIQHIPLALSDNASLLFHLLNMNFYQLGPDYLAKLPQRVRQIQPEDVNRAIQQWMHPDRMLVVQVGG